MSSKSGSTLAARWLRTAARLGDAGRASARSVRLSWVLRRARFGGTGSLQPFLGHRIKIHDYRFFYGMYKHLLVDRIYDFAAGRPDPRIIDGGSNIGQSVLYFKHRYPDARVTAFEPDPVIFPYLEENMRAAALEGVELRQAALADCVGSLSFASDGISGSCLSEFLPHDTGDTWERLEVPAVPLASLLDEPVDYLKLNIEGAEVAVLAAAAESLDRVQQMAVEYHHLPGLERGLGTMLEVLRDRGFEYFVYDFDRETNPDIGPPFNLTPDSRYYLLVYARRLNG